MITDTSLDEFFEWVCWYRWCNSLQQGFCTLLVQRKSFNQRLWRHTPLVQRESFSKSLLGVSDGRHGLEGKSEHNIPSSADEVCGQKLYYTTLKCPSIIDVGLSWGVESISCPISLIGSWRRNRGLRVVPATCKVLLEMFAQIWSLSGLAVIHKHNVLLPIVWKIDLPLYAWGPAY